MILQGGGVGTVVPYAACIVFSCRMLLVFSCRMREQLNHLTCSRALCVGRCCVACVYRVSVLSVHTHTHTQMHDAYTPSKNA